MTGIEILKIIPKLPPVLITAIGLFSLFVILEMDTHFPFIDLSPFRKDGNHYFSAAVIFSFIYLSVFLFVKKWQGIKNTVSKLNENRISDANIKTDIKELSEQELHTLSLYIYSEHKTIPFSVNFKPVRNLWHKRLINIRKGSIPPKVGTTDFTINNTAWVYLNKNKGIFNITNHSEIEELKEEVNEHKFLHSKYN